MESAVTIAVSPTSMSGTLRSRAWCVGAKGSGRLRYRVAMPCPLQPYHRPAPQWPPPPLSPRRPSPLSSRPAASPPTWMTSQSPRVNTSSGSSCTRVPFSSEVCSCTVTTWPLAGRLEPGGPGTSVFFRNSPFPARDRGRAAYHHTGQMGACCPGTPLPAPS